MDLANGLLDQLAGKAADIKDQREREAEQERAFREKVHGELSPRIQALFRYFRRLKDHLAVVQPEVSANYRIPGYGLIEELAQGDYRLFTDDPREQVERFTFQYFFTRPGTVEVRVEQRSTVRAYTEQLWNASLRFTTRDPGDGTHLFLIEQCIPVSFAFHLDLDRNAIRMTMRNVDMLGPVVNSLRPEQVNQELTTEITRCVLGERNALDELTGNALTKTGQFRLRRALTRMKEGQDPG